MNMERLVVGLALAISAASHGGEGVVDARWDTAKPGWYFEHPAWIAMKERFQRKCDSLEAVLRKRVPEKPDSIWHKDVGEFELNGEKMRWTTSGVRKYKPDTLPQALAVHPILLFSRPSNGAVVGVLTPSMGPVRIFSEFAVGGRGWFFDYGLKKNRMNILDHVSDAFAENVWRTSHDQALLADSVGKLLGWVSWDSIVGFESPKQVRQTQRFYTDGFADLLNGVYLDSGNLTEVIKGKPFPVQTWGPREGFWVNMFRKEIRHFYRSENPDLPSPITEIDKDYPKKNAPIFSSVKDPSSGRIVRYMDPAKLEKIPTLKVHWFFDGGMIGILPVMSVNSHPETFQMKARLLQDTLMPEETNLAMQFGESGPYPMELQLPPVQGGKAVFRPQVHQMIRCNAEIMP